MPDYRVPELNEAIALYTSVARITNPSARVGAISLNCSAVSPEQAKVALVKAEAETGLPAFDPLAPDLPAAFLNKLKSEL